MKRRERTQQNRLKKFFREKEKIRAELLAFAQRKLEEEKRKQRKRMIVGSLIVLTVCAVARWAGCH